MDPLSVTASIIAVLQLTVKIIDGLKHARDASTDRIQFTTEIQNLRDLLVALLSRVDEDSSDPWHTNVRQMGGQDGLIYQYRVALEQLKDKISTGEGLKKTAKTFLWKYIQQDADSILLRIERLKSLVQIALEMDHFMLSQAIESRVSSLQDDSKTIKVEIEAIQQGQDRQNQGHDLQKHYETMEWLSPDSFAAQQSDLITRKQADTGQWFLDSPEFTEWVYGTSQTLFCPGIPGAGKTMMAAIAVHHLQNTVKTADIGIAFVYCNYKRQADQTTPNLLAAIIKQLVQDRPSIAQPLSSLYDQHRPKRTRPLLEELLSVLHSVLAKYSKVYVVLDALDECSEQDGTRSQLLRLCRRLQQKYDLRLMATSRQIPDILEEFKNTPLVEVRASDSDLKRFVMGNMSRFAKFIRLSADLQELVQNRVVEAADGMFLLASLHVDSLVSKKTTTRLKSALDNLSHGSEALRDAYDEVIERIDGQVHDDCTLAKNVLSWISYARRPLTTKELCHALAVEMGDINFDSDNITDVEDILSVCAGLVTVDEESQTIRLVHYTAQKYLESIRENWHPEAQHKIASTCLTYLCFEPFRSSPCSNDDEFKSRRKAYSLLDYSARYWPEHVAAIQEEICELAMTLLQDSDLVASAHLHGDGRFDPFISSQVTGLHLTASIGLLCLSQELISWAKKEKMNLADSKDSKGATPLLWGIWSGRKNVVELLLGTGEVDVNVQDENKQTALLEAIIREQQEIAQLLLCTGEVDISVRNGRGWTALTVAILTGQKEMVELLLGADKFDVDVKVNGWTPLLLAVREGHKEIVELLLEKGADVEKTPDRVALSWYAVDRGYKDFFEFLLGTSTDTSKITDRWPLLALVAADRHKGIAELLGSEEIDLDAQGGYLNTPLWIHAVRKGRKDLVELLLDAGASVHVKDEQESTALMKAAFYNDKDMVELLIDRGADVHAIDMEGETALTIAAEYSGKEIVKMLLDRGADVNATGDGYPTALMMATRQACEEKIELLLGAGADVNAKDEDGVTALIDASYLCKKEVIKLLLRAGADVQAKDEQGETALMWAAQQDRKLGVRLLLGAGANIHAKDNNGSTALMGAVSFGCKDMVGMLLAKGSDIRAKNKEGSTVLMLAIHCISDRVAELVPDWDLKVMVELLLKKGADVHAKDEQGKTALMWAEEEECTEVADLLRTHMSRL